MKRFLLLLTLLTPLAAHAQPARDLFDAVQMTRAHERDLAPALALARETTAALKTLLVAEFKLGDEQYPAASALDRAISVLDDYDRDLTRRKAYLPRDVRKIMDEARMILDSARAGLPTDNTLLRDKFHHMSVHRLSRRVMEDMAQINQLLFAYNQIENQLRQLQSTGMNILAGSENAGGLPQPKP